MSSVVGEMDDSCYIGNIYNAPIDVTTALPVLVDQDGKLGTQGFNGSQLAVSILQNAHPKSMLNEFRNEQRRVEQLHARISELDSKIASQAATIAAQQKQIGVLTAELKDQAAETQKVSAQVEMNKSTKKVVLNNH
jgi:septal ring factor EnvC (AmiA/AmiB activator)